MAIYRMIELSFWSDPKVADEFTPEDRYMYLYLMTNPHTNLAGCYEISIRQMSIETGYCKESVESILNRMENVHGVISYSKETREVLLKNWYKHNWQKSPKYMGGVRNQIMNIKDDGFREYLAEKMDTLFIGYKYPLIETISNTTSIDEQDIYESLDDTDNSKSKRKTKKNTIHDSYSTDMHRHGEYGHVLLTQKQYDKLVEDYGEEATKRAIQNVDEYCQQHGKRYKDYNLTLRKWGYDGIANKKTGTQRKPMTNQEHNFEILSEFLKEAKDEEE